MRERASEGGTWGRYRLGERLGIGGMAEVFRAVAPGAAGFEKACVIKRILPEYIGDKNFVSMFVNEARIGASLAHPNIVQIYDFGEIEGEYFMAMEFVHGTDLARFLWRLLQRKRTVPGQLVAFIALDVLRALEFAHNRSGPDGRPSPVIHRDVSPQNILISTDGLVKLADFGLARALDHARLTRPGTLKGKLSYMSPEQAFGREMDHRTDLFSLGIVMYELLTGKSLFRAKSDAETLARVRAAAVPEFEKAVDVHASLATALRRALAREQENRFQSAAEFRRALADYLRGVSPPVEAGTLGALVRDVLRDGQKPPEHTADATGLAEAAELEVAQAPTLLPTGEKSSDSDLPDGAWSEGPGAPVVSAAAKATTPARPKTPPPMERIVPPTKPPPGEQPKPAATTPAPTVMGVGVVRVQHVLVVGGGSTAPPPVTVPPRPGPKVSEASGATLIAPPRGREIPVTPPHGVPQMEERDTQLYDGTPPSGADEAPARDSERKLTMLRPVMDLPELTPPSGQSAGAPAAAPVPAAGGGPEKPLYSDSGPPPSQGEATPAASVSDPPVPPLHGPGIIGLVLIGVVLLVVSAVVTWLIVS